jgi:iron complex outermembrane receptor protein
MKSSKRSRLLLSATPVIIAVAIEAMPSGAFADADAGDSLEQIVVTARKVAEDPLQVPEAIQVLTAKDIDTRGVVTLDDLALFTPGLTDDQTPGGGARTDRSFQQFIIRGMNPSGILNPTTSLFVNGVPIPSALLQNVGDADRIEVLEGPQSAYFGKDTFAGAINVVTKTPPSSFGGYATVEEGTRQTEDYKLSLGGPVVADKLSFLTSVDYNSHEGSYRNAANPGEHLGNQSTLTGDLTVLIKPVDNLSMKFYGLVLADRDGPSATGLILTTPAGNIPAQSNCVVGGNPWVCGTLPKLLPTSPAQNDAVTPAIASFLATGGKLVNAPTEVDKFGLQRNAFFGDSAIDYTIPSMGLTLTSLTGIAKDEVSELSDLSNLDGPAVGVGCVLCFGFPYTGYPFLTEQRNSDVSQEFRIASDPSKPYRFLLGASYVDELVKSSLGAPGLFGFYENIGPTETITRGVYFSAAYDFLPQLTVDFEGRYQYDDVSALDPVVTNQIDEDAHFHNFLPRASAKYKFSPTLMTYFTYSEGINTGSFNTQISSLPPAAQAFFTSAPYNASVIVQPEKLRNYELGIKATFLDGKANVAADVYYDKWSKQLVARSFTIAPNSTNPPNPEGGSPDLIGWSDNSGASTAKGLEVTANLIPIDHVTLNVSGAINDTTYDTFSCLPCASYLSTVAVNAAGNQLPNASKYSATAGIQYSDTLALWRANDWYVRADFIYKSGFYLEPLNTSETPATEIVNLRAGVNWEQFRLEGFVTNLFNNKAYTSGIPDDNFTAFPPYYSAVMVGLPQLITGGVRLRLTF